VLPLPVDPPVLPLLEEAVLLPVPPLLPLVPPVEPAVMTTGQGTGASDGVGGRAVGVSVGEGVSPR
jgi:hypothetical protein